jgi:hypothetical protein
MMPIIANYVINNFFRELSIAILMCIGIPFMIVPVLAVIILTYFNRKYCIAPQNDCKRYDSVTKAPINTKFGSVY